MAREPNAHRTQIIIALIGTAGVLGAATISALVVLSSRNAVEANRPAGAEGPKNESIPVRTVPSGDSANGSQDENVAGALRSYLSDGGRLREGRMAHALRAMSELEIAAPERMTSGEHLSRVIEDQGYERERRMLAARLVLQSGDTEDVAQLRAALER